MPVQDGEWAIGPDYFNAGFFIMKPSKELYQHYLSLMNPTNGTKIKFESRYLE
jgi:alpha-N-acetylglucosamine transferase